MPAAWGAYSSSLNRVLIATDTAADLPAVTLSRLDALPEGEYAYDEVLESVELLGDEDD